MDISPAVQAFFYMLILHHYYPLKKLKHLKQLKNEVYTPSKTCLKIAPFQ